MAGETPVPLLPINVWLAGRSYRIRIPVSEEASVRRAIKSADQKITELRQHYAGRDDQDFVAMCLVMYATAEAGAGLSSIEQDEITEMIRKIDKALERDGGNGL
jgi:cell division protein ZapA